jgi:mannose/cellobiose epimerase-like protein (N-acyl-D-glucosamine 2-epimerase family)
VTTSAISLRAGLAAWLRRALIPTLFLVMAVPVSTEAKSFKEYARDFHQQLATKTLPYWYDTSIDTNYGGYVLADDGKGHRDAKEKQLVSQARMLWTFSHVHRKGYSDERRDYLKAAAHGYRFLQERFLDRDHGGYFWKTDLSGKPTNDRKILYGQSFVIYALVEYYRASGNPEALRRANELYRSLQNNSYDAAYGGWIEHFTRDWQFTSRLDAGAEVEVPGLKSANAHLHLMEALAELYQVTQNSKVRRSLEESLAINKRYFYPVEAGKSCFHREPDWRDVTAPESAGLSYGHNVEFAWLMVRAEQVLSRQPSWKHFEAHLRHALSYGYDYEHGGLYNRGTGDEPASQKDKVWWVQAEMLAALTDGFKQRPNEAYSRALSLLLEFVTAHQVDPADGIWFDTVTEDGQRKNPAKAHNWKANYHDVRALVKFIEAFGK